MKNPFRNAIVAAVALLVASAVTTGLMAQQAPAAPAAPAASAPAAAPAPAASAQPAAASAPQANPFSLTLPTGFTPFAKQTQTVKTPDGKDETITNWISKAPATGEAVVVTVSKMPGKILDPASTISHTRDSVVKSLKAEVESDNKLTGELPGEEVLFHSGTAAYLRAQLAVKDDSLYQLLYVGRTTDQRSAPTVAQLFNSFKITGAAAAPATQTTASTSH